MLKTIKELEELSSDELKELLTTPMKWIDLSLEEQYHSKLYKLTSKLNEIYNNNLTVSECIDLLSLEDNRRLTNNIPKN